MEEEVSRLNDRISEAAHGVQSISMTSIPPDFFDEERDKMFQLEIVQDSLAERVDRLIKKSTEVDARLDIIEEEMEEQTKISINGNFNIITHYDSLIMTHRRDSGKGKSDCTRRKQKTSKSFGKRDERNERKNGKF